MTGKRDRGGAERLSLHNEGAGASIAEAPRKAASRPKRHIPRKPSPTQIERFEALRARVMGRKLHITPAGALTHEPKP